MTKLINKFASEPTLANARKLVAYDNKHPMATVALSWDSLEHLNSARTICNIEGMA